MDILLQQIINGLVLGSMYALIALGYTMVYGIIQLINFAHGEVLMIGALTSWSCIGLMQEAMPGAPAVKPNDPAAYKPQTEFDNTPWRFNADSGRGLSAAALPSSGGCAGCARNRARWCRG